MDDRQQQVTMNGLAYHSFGLTSWTVPPPTYPPAGYLFYVNDWTRGQKGIIPSFDWTMSGAWVWGGYGEVSRRHSPTDLIMSNRDPVHIGPLGLIVLRIECRAAPVLVESTLLDEGRTFYKWTNKTEGDHYISHIERDGRWGWEYTMPCPSLSDRICINVHVAWLYVSPREMTRHIPSHYGNYLSNYQFAIVKE